MRLALGLLAVSASLSLLANCGGTSLGPGPAHQALDEPSSRRLSASQAPALAPATSAANATNTAAAKPAPPTPLLTSAATPAPSSSATPAPDAAGPALADEATPAPVTTTVVVARDRKIEVAPGPPSSAEVVFYLHGFCGDPFAFKSWLGAATKHATFISIRGDRACPKRPGRSKWSRRYQHFGERLAAAIAAAEPLRRAHAGAQAIVPLDISRVVLIGYSQGAKRVEELTARYPSRYRRVVIIATPDEPKLSRLAKTERVLLIAGAWDRRSHMRKAGKRLQRAKRPVRYLELPKARHGEYGPQGHKVMAQGLDWLYEAELAR